MNRLKDSATDSAPFVMNWGFLENWKSTAPVRH